MHYSYNTLTAALTGMGGGMVKFMLQIDQPFPEKLLHAGITAMVCGAAGVIGKEFVVYLKNKLRK